MSFPDFKGTKVGGESDVTLQFPWSVMLTLALLAAITMVVVWDTTTDLAESVDRLAIATERISAQVKDGERERFQLNTRIQLLEAETKRNRESDDRRDARELRDHQR